MFKIFCCFETREHLKTGRINAATIIRDVQIVERGNKGFHFSEGMEIQFTNKSHFLRWVGRMIDLRIPYSTQILAFPSSSSRLVRNDALFVKTP